MSELKTKLSATIKDSMKSGQKERLLYARNLHSAIRKLEIDSRVDCDDAAVMKIVQTMVKQRQDSIDQFTQGGRMDLVEKESAELAFLMEFLPAQLSDQELSDIVKAAIQEAQATSAKDMGKVMAAAQPKIQGRADGKRVSARVKELLSELS
jgi:uncharacterized protein